MKKTMKRPFHLILTILILASSLSFTACSSKTSQQQNVITTVINSIYTCPNAEYKKAYIIERDIEIPALMKDVQAGATISITEENSSLQKYLKETYMKYLTQSAYERLLSTNVLTRFQNSSISNEWTSTVKKLEIKSVSTDKYNYDGTVEYSFNSDPKTMKSVRIVGTAEFTDGKISWLTISKESTLMGQLTY
jgi:hypothetical protein